MRPIYLTVAIISPRTQQQRNSKWNQFSCHGLRIKKFQLELLFSKSIFLKSYELALTWKAIAEWKKLRTTAFFQNQIAIPQHFHKPSLEKKKKIFVSFCNLLLQLNLSIINLMPLNNKVLGIQDKNNSKEEDRRIQELFSSTRSGAVYLLYTKAQCHWFELTGGHKTKKRNQDKETYRRHKTKKEISTRKKKVSTNEEKTQDWRKRRKSQLWERNEKWILSQ